MSFCHRGWLTSGTAPRDATSDDPRFIAAVRDEWEYARECASERAMGA